MKRRIAIVLLLLAGGAVVNVAVAWGSAWSRWGVRVSDVAISTSYTRDKNTKHWLGVHRVCAFGYVEHEVSMFYRSDAVVTAGHELIELQPAFLGQGSPATWPIVSAPWSKLGVHGIGGEMTGIEHEAAAGWPMLALWRAVSEFDPQTSTYETIPVGTFRPSTFSGADVFLLTHPIWAGFIINTLFYALVLWLIVFAPFAARRALRRRRGLCEKCAYPIGISAVCTECGAAIAASRRAAGVLNNVAA